MQRISRRRALAIGGLGALVAAAGGASAPAQPVRHFDADPFALGVASGDPSVDGVVLWTRLAPVPLSPDGLGGMPPVTVPVEWELATEGSMRNVVRRGSAYAVPELAHSVHVEVRGLPPGREYYYRFRAGDAQSPVGRTTTVDARAQRVRFALASCQVWVGGRYASYRTMAAEDLDLVVHVGDYIYEEDTTESLADYRVLHALYKTSPDLQLAHSLFPFVTTFDDHEVENNWAGEYSPRGYDDAEVRRFARVRAAAFQAYYEHLPLRLSARPDGHGIRLYRRLTFGRLLGINVLDTRQYRSDPRLPASAATMLGVEQERWLFDGLARSDTTWNALAQQIVMARFDYDTGPGEKFNTDQWDAFPTARDRLLHGMGLRHIRNPVVLSGDWHSSWVNELKADWSDPASPTLATEFVGPSISSGCPWAAEVTAALPANPHVRFFDGDRRGWVRCTVTPTAWRSDYRTVVSADDTAHPAETLTSWTVENGQSDVGPT